MISEPGLDHLPKDNARETHLDDVVRALTTGRLTFFLGAGANACSRPHGLNWETLSVQDNAEHLPLGKELAIYLSKEFKYPYNGNEDLARVSQWIAMTKSIGTLYDHLNFLFNRDYPPTTLHCFLASLPSLLRSRTSRSAKELGRFLIVTTNYDDLLERAFSDANQDVHIITFKWDKESGYEDMKGRFFHHPPGGSMRRIDRPNDYKGLQDDLPIILKIHGAIVRQQSDLDSLVITEDHYLDYIDSAPGKAASFFPNPLPKLLLNSSFLFLGYALKDWNLRIVLRRLWRERTFDRKAWSIQVGVDEHDALFWNKRKDISILDWSLADYVDALRARVEAIPPKGRPRSMTDD